MCAATNKGGGRLTRVLLIRIVDVYVWKFCIYSIMSSDKPKLSKYSHLFGIVSRTILILEASVILFFPSSFNSLSALNVTAKYGPMHSARSSLPG